MNLLFIAGILAVILGLVHTGLGEKLIFSGWRKAAPDIPRRHRNIIWASWHLVTICCIAFGILLMGGGQGAVLPTLVLYTIVAAFLMSSGLVLFATRGKHPGWLVLLVIAFLTVLAANP